MKPTYTDPVDCDDWPFGDDRPHSLEERDIEQHAEAEHCRAMRRYYKLNSLILVLTMAVLNAGVIMGLLGWQAVSSVATALGVGLLAVVLIRWIHRPRQQRGRHR